MILAFDLATVTGVACGRPCEAPVAWSFRLTGDHAARFGELLRVTNRLIKERQPQHVVIEAPFVGPHPKAAQLLFGLRGVVLGMAVLHSIPVTEVQVKDIRKHFLGHGGGKRANAKALVMERCRRLGWPVRSEDEADALALWDFAASKISEKHSQMTMELGNGARM